MRIAIAGAGMAGLASAALLARAGHEVMLCDRFPAPAPVGSGLMVQPVGMAVLGLLGVADDLRAEAAPIDHVYGRNDRGRVVLDVRYGALRGDAVGLGVARSTLFDVLHLAAMRAGVDIRTSTEIVAAGQDGDHAWLEAGAGVRIEADLVLDCLGAMSPLCPKPSRVLAYGALWALLDWPEDAPFLRTRLEQRYRAAHRMVGVLPVGRDKLTFFWSLKGEDHAAWRAAPLVDWKTDVTGLWPDCAGVLGQITDHDDLIFAQYTHRTLHRPGLGRIAHLGDSYHATSPQLGQGANMALLDALALTTALERETDPVRAVALYGQLRRAHVWLYQTASWLFTPAYQSDSRVLPWLRDLASGPVSGLWPVNRILARLVAGELGAPLSRLRPAPASGAATSATG